MIHAGLCRLRLDPPVFWALTLRELAACCGGLAVRQDRPDRHTLETLMRIFPDGAP